MSKIKIICSECYDNLTYSKPGIEFRIKITNDYLLPNPASNVINIPGSSPNLLGTPYYFCNTKCLKLWANKL